MLRVDHVVRAVPDLDEASWELQDAAGLEAAPGGVHPAWGTANRILPLGETYLELITVADPETAARSEFGRVVAELAAEGGGWLVLCLADDDLEGTAARLSLEVRSGGRTLPDGSELRWRSAGLEDPRRTPELPFFISWDVPAELHPGRVAVGGAAASLAAIELAGDAGAFTAWTAGAELPVRFVGSEPAGVRGVVLRTADGGELELG